MGKQAVYALTDWNPFHASSSSFLHLSSIHDIHLPILMDHHHHHHHLAAASPAADRLPQWTHAETSDLLSIRAELDRAFMETKRNKPLWEAISSRMQLRGHNRTPDQCKSKWKNLVTRFKGVSDFPFRHEMEKIYDDRKRLGESERCDHVEGEVMEVLLREVGRRQREMEERWAEEEEAREAERRAAEAEWRRGMEAIWEERAEMERRWREREEERRARAEERAERRHRLITVLLTRLVARDGG